jgi:transposase
VGKRFDKEFKLHAVKLVVEEGNTIAETARQLDLSPKTLHRWVSDYKEDPVHSFVGSGNLRPEEQVLREAQKRIRDLEEENAILKKDMSIFAKNQK